MFEVFFGKHITDNAVYIIILVLSEQERRREMRGGGRGLGSAEHRGMQTLLANCILCLSSSSLSAGSLA